MDGDSATPRRRRRRDGGAAAVEAALLLPAFLALIFGIIEGALLVNSNLTVANTTMDASREAAVFGKDIEADYQILQAVQGSIGAALVGDPIRLVIWHADGLDDTIPPGCESGTPSSTVGSECNVYEPGDPEWTSTDPTDFDCSVTSPARYWCPTSRVDTASGPPDYVGIYLLLDHAMITGFIGQDVEIVRSSIARIEPKTVD